MSINITLGPAAVLGNAMLPYSIPRVSETVSTAGTASTATAQGGELWTVTAEADVFVEFAASPTPDGAGTTRHRIKSGQTRQFIARTSGERVAFATT